MCERLREVAAAYDAVRALQAMAGLWALVIVMRRMHVHPRLALIGKSLHGAFKELPDLLFVFAACLVVFAVFGHVVFASAVEQLSSPGAAVDHLVTMLLGGTTLDETHALLEQRAAAGPGAYSFGGMADLFPVVMFRALAPTLLAWCMLNFVLAIVGDHFTAQKESMLQATRLEASHKRSLRR